MTNIDTKELSIVKQQVTKAMSAAQDVTIASDDDLTKATDVLVKIKQVGKLITQNKEKITKPLNEALKHTRELFKPLEADFAAAEVLVKNKITAYQQSVAKKLEADRAKIAAKVESGKMSFNKAADKIEQLPAVPTTVQGKNGGIETRTVRKVRIIDVTKLPPQYLIPDEVKVRKDGLAGVAELLNSGAIEVYEDATVAVKA